MIGNTEQLLAELKLASQEAAADDAWVSKQQDVNKKRLIAQPEIAQLLNDFLSGDLSTADFREDFQHKTINQWAVFGLKGLSGAMFLNKLVKHVPDQLGLTREVQRVLKVPTDKTDAKNKMDTFQAYLNDLIANKQVTKLQVQPARAMFFVSSFWHKIGRASCR